MHKLSVILFFLIIPISIFSGNGNKIYLKPIIGLNLYKTTDNFVKHQTSTEYKNSPIYKFGFIVGTEIMCRMNNSWTISSGLEYNQQGSKYSEFSTGNDEEKWLHTDENLDLQYLSIPFILAYNIGRTHFYIKAGLRLDFLLSAKYKYSINHYMLKEGVWMIIPEDVDKEKIDIMNLCNKVGINIPIGVSYEYKKFTIELMYGLGLTKINNTTDNNIYNRNIVLKVGYKINL